MPRPGAVLVALALVLTAPAATWAQTDSPFSPLPQAPQQPGPAPTPVPVQPEADEGLAGWQQLALLGGAVLLLAAIAAFIVRDARRSAPAADAQKQSKEAAGKRAQHTRKRGAARSKGRAARAARRRNR